MAKAFVFSGGGAYAVPELGIVKYIEEARLFNPDTDLAIGTSFGAIAAGSLTLNHSPQNMLKMLEDFDKISRKVLTSSSIAWSAFSFPFLWGLKSLINILAPYFGGFENNKTWPKGLITCSTDLTTFSPFYFNDATFASDQIPVLEAVASSASIPFVFQPVSHHGHVFVDGGIVENVPTTPAEEKEEIYVFGHQPGRNYRVAIDSLESYFGAIVEGAIFRLNEMNTVYEQQDNFIGYHSQAKHILDFSNYQTDFQEGYQKAKAYFERRN